MDKYQDKFKDFNNIMVQAFKNKDFSILSEQKQLLLILPKDPGFISLMDQINTGSYVSAPLVADIGNLT